MKQPFYQKRWNKTKYSKRDSEFLRIQNIINDKIHQWLFIYLGFYVAFNTVQVIWRRVVGRAVETSTYSWSRFCTVNWRATTSFLTWGRAGNRTLTSEVGDESVTILPLWPLMVVLKANNIKIYVVVLRYY